MDVSNSIVSANFARSLQENRSIKPEQESRADVRERPSANRSSDIDADGIAERGRQVQAERVQRVGDLESVPLRTRQALSSYEQTAQSAIGANEGELVGVDLFV